MPLRLLSLSLLVVLVGASCSYLYFSWEFMERRDWLWFVAVTSSYLAALMSIRTENTESRWVQRVRLGQPRGWRSVLLSILLVCSATAGIVGGYEAYERIQSREHARRSPSAT